MDKLNLIHITPAYKPAYCYGGPTLSVARLCEELTARYPQLNLVVLTTLANGKQELDVPSGLATVVDGVDVKYSRRLTKDHTHFSPALLWSLKGSIQAAKRKREKIIIHIHSWWNLVAILSALMAKLYDVPLVISPRGMVTSYTLSFRNRTMKAFIHHLIAKPILRNTQLHATSMQEKQHIQQHCNLDRISIIPNVFTFYDSAVLAKPKAVSSVSNDTLQKHKLQTGVQHLNILFLSRIDPKKGLDLLMEALSTVQFKWELTIAGPGDATYITYLQQLAFDLQISNKLTWLGAIDNQEKFPLLASHDILALTSRNENFANVVLESLLVGTAVLVSNQVGLSDYIQQRNLGWVCGTDPEEIATALKNIYVDKARRLDIQKRAADALRQDFDTERIIRDYFIMYQEVIKHHDPN